MSGNTQEEKDKISELARMAGMDEKVVRAAGLSEERLSFLFEKAVANERFQNRYVTPAGSLALALGLTAMLAGMHPDGQEFSRLLVFPLIPALGVYIIGRDGLNKVPAIRREISKAAEARLVQLDTQKPAP